MDGTIDITLLVNLNDLSILNTLYLLIEVYVTMLNDDFMNR